ncbi:MAG: hypothetical protein K8T91_01585 [Planctomycetes bacterium]|nr:hypothetical protein [Planctomycetota bacterium]
MSIIVQCECGKQFRAADDKAGRKALCPHCQAVLVLPSPTPEDPDALAKAASPAPPRKQWHMRAKDGQSYGPVSRQQLDAWFSERRITSGCYLWQDGDKQMRHAKDVYPALENSSESVAIRTSANPFEGELATPRSSGRDRPSGRITLVSASRRHRGIPLIIAIIVVLAFIPAYSWNRNSGLRRNLKACETFDVVRADVYYDGFLSTNAIVFDLKDGGSSSARRIDPVHLFFEFSAKSDLNSSTRIILAHNGQQKFYISNSDLKRLSESYAGGGRPWAFNNLPERLRTMSGSQAYESWSGGWLGVLQKQTQDLNDFITMWSGN